MVIQVRRAMQTRHKINGVFKPDRIALHNFFVRSAGTEK